MIIDPLFEILPIIIMHETAQKTSLLEGIPVIGKLAKYSCDVLMLLSPGGIPVFAAKITKKLYLERKEPSKQ
jgi:hypothetical protein